MHLSCLGCLYSSTYMECWFAISVSHLGCLYIYIHGMWICYLCISLGLSLHLHTCSVDLLSLYLTRAVSTSTYMECGFAISVSHLSCLYTYIHGVLICYLCISLGLSLHLHTWNVDLLSLYLTWAVSTSTYMECGFAISVSHLGCLYIYIHVVLICYLCISLELSLHLHTCSVDLLSLYLTWAVSTSTYM